MGFYCQIFVSTEISQDSGKPVNFVITVPEEYRRFLYEKGRWFQAYMREGIWIDSLEHVLEEFPSWEDVQEQFPVETNDKNGWSENDHNLFREAVTWFSKQKQMFIVMWG